MQEHDDRPETTPSSANSDLGQSAPILNTDCINCINNLQNTELYTKKGDSENHSHDKYQAEFIQFWNTYDKKQDLFKVRNKFNSLKPDEVKAILIHVPKYVASTSDKKFRKNPLTYLNGRCWEDEIQNEGPKFYNENNRPWNGW
jgi:hypothetical protein